MRAPLLAVLIAVAAAAVSSHPIRASVIAEETETDFASLKRLTDAAYAQLEAEDTAAAAITLRAVIAHPRFADLPTEVHYGTFVALALTQYANGDVQDAYNRLIQAGTVAPRLRDADYWFGLSDVCADLHRETESLDAVLTVIRTWPDALRAADSDYVFNLVVRAKALDDGGQRRRQVLEGLYAMTYTPENVFMTSEGLWFDLFELYADAGETEKATVLAANFTETASLVRLKVDNRYAAYRGDAARLDLRAAIDRSVLRSRGLMAAHPRRIEGVYRHAYDLLDAGQPEEARRVIDAALKKVGRAPKDTPAYDDLDKNLNWTLDARNTVLARLGRWEEAEKAQIRARDHALAAGQDVVSQKVNLGVLYYLTGQPVKALAEIDGVDLTQSSPYGIMAAEEVRACAYAQTGDAKKLKASLEFMTAQVKDGYGPLRSALLCAGDIDALSAVVIARLEDPVTRADTLIDLQAFRPEPHPTDVMRRNEAGLAQLRARSDVQAAVAKYGVLVDVPTFRPMN